MLDGKKPTWVSAEHSTYLTAFNSRASFSPWSIVMTLCLFLASFSTVAASSLKSIWVPTNKNGVFWQWCVISGTHFNCKNKRLSKKFEYRYKVAAFPTFSLTFSNEEGDTTEKHTKKTSVWG